MCDERERARKHTVYQSSPYKTAERTACICVRIVAFRRSLDRRKNARQHVKIFTIPTAAAAAAAAASAAAEA
jgi:hypothetical protein